VGTKLKNRGSKFKKGEEKGGIIKKKGCEKSLWSFNISKFYLWCKKLFFLLFSSSFEKGERKLSNSSDGKKKSQLKLI
jgi:hypothetical protein